MPSKNRRRWAPLMGEFRKMVAIVAAEVPSGNVTDIFHAVRRRCKHWAVTPHRVRKALSALQNSKKKMAKSTSDSRSSTDSVARIFPLDVVELRSSAKRSKHAQWQWRGQVLRVAGYDEGETTDEEDQELPPGHCFTFWLGPGLEQWPKKTNKESSLRVIDRPWVLGDRVARVDDPRSLGTVIGVSSRLRFSGISGPEPISAEVPVQAVRAEGGFRAEDWVAHDASHWVGKVEEAVFHVEVEICGKVGEQQRATRGKGRQKPAKCMFQVSSEGLQGLDPAGGEDVTPQELSPHFPGQRVKAPARLWRQADWLRGSLGRRSPRRGTPICGIVTSVECCLLAVRWLAGAVKDSSPPDEWVPPETVRVLTVPNSNESWAIGDHVQAPTDWHSPSAVIVESRTVVNVRWADGSVEEGVPSLKLCPRPHISPHDFLPNDFVARSGEGFGEMLAGTPGGVGGVVGNSLPPTTSATATSGLVPFLNPRTVEDEAIESTVEQDGYHLNSDEATYGYALDSEDATGDRQMPATTDPGEILASDNLGIGGGLVQSDQTLGVVTSVNMQARTAVVRWAPPPSNSVDGSMFPPPSGEVSGEGEEVSVFELTDHPVVDVRLGDAVFVPVLADLRWVGRVCSLRADGTALVELVDGCSRWYDVQRLIVVDDGDGSQSGAADGAGSEDNEVSNSEEESEWADAQSFNPPHTSEVHIPLSYDDGCNGNTEGGCETIIDGSSEPEKCSGSVADVAKSFAPLHFDAFSEDVEPTHHFFVTQPALGTRQQMMAVRREMVVLRKGLSDVSPSAGDSQSCAAPIIVRTFSSRSDLFRAMVVGPPGTPYANVPFFFDLALPTEYPREPPLAHFHAHFVGQERLNPNLYVDGKVCLSLLGTWSGPSWDPQRSTLLQVLVSLQGLILVEEPYFNEPGHESDVGTEHGRQSSALYNEHARLLSLRAALNVVQSPPRGFEEIVADFFELHGRKLVEESMDALSEAKASETSEGYRKVLAKAVLPRLVARWGSPSKGTSTETSTSAAT